ncbi:aldo/keto reductase [Flavobacterium cyanobacteriorum]|uniref:Aldo/keto reductase n=1 Tax=Flavobacterium cyanobacteriorum TaxID=2022802 RepID=A0A255YX51_9FLAO|nr:aldo/keto reductase [Flavobacterium cyanobacteriorum]OYQ32990.1 aldo/keto reductase [Flavobacterium cyanobacteriorum]
MKYKLLGNSGLRVSELALGTMTFGTEWGWGADKDESRKIFDAYAGAGGNFIDTANRYTEGTSEKFVGEFIRKERDHFVLATKYTLFDKMGDVNYSGNHRKNMMRSVEQSLKRLNTDYIDLLWVHAWDFLTPVEEVLRGLDDLVRSGKVHYIGVSDTPAWIVSRANTIAEFRGWSSFVGLQVEYSLLQRTPERDLIPMAKEMGLALTPWAPLAGGALTGKYLKGHTGRIAEASARRNQRSTAIAAEVVTIAEEMGVTPAQVALKWVMQKGFNSIPIVGGRRVEQIIDSLGATSLTLPDHAIAALDKISTTDMGFPHDFLESEEVKKVVYGGTKGTIIV